MNQENTDYLKRSMEIMGFGDNVKSMLENAIKGDTKEFQLTTLGEHQRNGVTENVEYKLDFRKSDTSDMYFFNKYNATLKNEEPAKEKSHTFYVSKDLMINAREAYNMLSGRAVNKDMMTKEKEPYNAWMQLDFSKKDDKGQFEVKKFSTNYGYDLEATLNKYPIKEIENNGERARLITSLEKGNVVPVTFVREGVEQKMFIEANPQFKTLNLYDVNMKKQFQGNDKLKEKQEEIKKSVKPDGAALNEGDAEKKSRKRTVAR